MRVKTLIIALALAAPAVGLAGPFCVVGTGLGQDCKYYDEASCAQAAVKFHGACVDKSTGVSSGFNSHAPYCLVGGGDTVCSYYDQSSCAKAAQDHGGSCIARK